MAEESTTPGSGSTIDVKALAEQLSKLNRNIPDLTKAMSDKSSSADDFAKELELYTKNIRAANPRINAFKDAMSGSLPNFKKMDYELNDLEKTIESLGQAIEEANKKATEQAGTKEGQAAHDRAEALKSNKTKAEKTLAESKSTLTTQKWTSAVSGLAGQMVKVAEGYIKREQMLYDAALSYSSGLLSGKSVNDLYTESVSSTTKANNEFNKSITGAVGGIGNLVSAMSLFMPGGLVVKGIALAGISNTNVG
jgi:hypothetical protein